MPLITKTNQVSLLLCLFLSKLYLSLFRSNWTCSHVCIYAPNLIFQQRLQHQAQQTFYNPRIFTFSHPTLRIQRHLCRFLDHFYFQTHCNHSRQTCHTLPSSHSHYLQHFSLFNSPRCHHFHQTSQPVSFYGVPHVHSG